MSAIISGGAGEYQGGEIIQFVSMGRRRIDAVTRHQDLMVGKTVASGSWPYSLFEREPADHNKTVLLDQEDPVLEHGKAVRCAYCKTIVTYQGNAEHIQGQHVHRCVNPQGYEFTIGCFRRAWCKVLGLPSLEWTWFHGYSWQYALCPQCGEHLGWFYHAAVDDSRFYGLILDRLITDTE